MEEIKMGCNQFYIGESEKDAIARITFIPSGDRLIVDHTYVSETLRGKGIAQKLLNRVVEYARKENKKIVPQCSYAERVMTQGEQYKDVLCGE